MNDMYVGDIGDFGKIALLRELRRQGFTIGINWYKSDVQPTGKRIGIPDRLADIDPNLSSRLRDVFSSQGGIDALESFIPDAIYFSDSVPVTGREEWHQRSLTELAGVKLVFLDPDNGLIVSSARKKDRVKYVLDEEIAAYLDRDQSILLYQHRPRVKEKEFIDSVRDRLSGMKHDSIQVITFPRYSTRDYFAISVCEQHSVMIRRALIEMQDGKWGEMCAIQEGK